MIALIENIFLLAALVLFLAHIWLYTLRWFEIANSEQAQFPRRLTDALRTPLYWGPFLAEFFYHLISLALASVDAVRLLIARLANTPPSPVPHPEEEGLCAPVVLVPGYMMGCLTLYPLKWWLQRQGLSPTVPISFSPPWGDLEVLAEQLKERVEEVYEASGRTKVTLIAHSMGGLVSRFYLAKLGGGSHVKKVIFLATPHQGTKLWTFALGPCAPQMRPGSPFLLSLDTAKSEAPGIPMISLYSTFDEMVIPAANARMGSSGAVNLPVEAAGHNAYLFSRRVYRKILEVLEPSPAKRPLDSGPLL